MANNDNFRNDFEEPFDGRFKERKKRITLGRRLRVNSLITDRAFFKTANRIHKDHPGLNRTFSLPFFLTLALFMLYAMGIRQFIAEPTMVDGQSMQYTLLNRERLLVEKISYWSRDPQRGDIVIVKYPGSKSRYVKRIVALPGETIEIKKAKNDGYVYIDGERLDESAYAGADWYGNIKILVKTKGNINGKYTVPEGHYFVIGDNRNDSMDSRDPRVGPIPMENIIGRVSAVIWPINRIRVP